MFPIVMSILAATSIYAGFLMFNQDSIAGIAGVLLGIILIINPSLLVIRRFRAFMGNGSHDARPAGPQKKSPKKPHLKLVRSEQDEERPTIH
jgi:hypothetical protein